MLQKKQSFYEGFYNALFLENHYLNSLLLGALFLFPVNWAFETLKWKFLVSKVERIDFFKAYRGILTGVTFGMITPFSVGDYIGRILQLSGPDRIKLVGAIFLSRIAQFFITLIFGAASLIYFIVQSKEANRPVFYLAVLASAAAVILLLLFVYHKAVLLFIKNIQFFSPLYTYLEILNRYTKKELVKVVIYSLLRYMVFSIQFIFLFLFFEISKDLTLLCMAVAFIFLVKSIVPTVLDLGVREASAVYFFTAFGFTNGNNVVFASLTLWTINILLPALLGLFLIFKIKLIPK